MGIVNSAVDMIQKYGGRVKVVNGNTVMLARAFVEPLRYKNKIYIGGRRHELGMYDNEKYLYIGLPSCTLIEDESVIESGVNKYIVKRCETYRVGDIPVYVWAILGRYCEQMEDEYDER